MFLHQLQSPIGSRKKRKIVGRGPGSGHGKTSGRGVKGQRARFSAATLPGSEGGQSPLIRRIPKFGFRSKNPTVYQVVNIQDLNKFDEGGIINKETLKKQGLIKSLNKPVKILGQGEITKRLVVQLAHISKTAREKLIKAGTKIEDKSVN